MRILPVDLGLGSQ